MAFLLLALNLRLLASLFGQGLTIVSLNLLFHLLDYQTFSLRQQFFVIFAVVWLGGGGGKGDRHLKEKRAGRILEAG